jgi:hypothetical protein
VHVHHILGKGFYIRISGFLQSQIALLNLRKITLGGIVDKFAINAGRLTLTISSSLSFLQPVCQPSAINKALASRMGRASLVIVVFIAGCWKNG